ncbi:MAG: DUF971 domain-containing protein [Chloroflexi bacterium]|nr:MAG: DUF971 domain-containing protein [Chloroflexota bacterium]
MGHKPTGIKANRSARTLTITWDDGHISEYSFAGLRAICPCVECKGGHENMGTPADPRLVREAHNPDLNLQQIQQVGGYAIQFMWSDGHWAGIYTWEYLRQACPCEVCATDD